MVCGAWSAQVVQQRVGHRVLCKRALHAAQAKLQYLHVNITEMYARA